MNFPGASREETISLPCLYSLVHAILPPSQPKLIAVMMFHTSQILASSPIL